MYLGLVRNALYFYGTAVLVDKIFVGKCLEIK